jgi:NAD-dependent SIR2 family protein deacetylase
VVPAASLPFTVKRKGGTLVEVNPLQSELSYMCDVCVRAPSGEALSLLVSRLKEKMGF